MKRNWIILIALWILSLVGISYFGGPVSYGFFATVTLVPIVSLIYLFFVFLRFKIYQRLEGRNVVANTASDFYIALQNEDFFTFSGIRILFYSSFSSISGIDDSIEYELIPHTGVKKDTKLLCKYRGEYEVGVKSIVIQDFFRLFRFTYRNREPFRVRVLPKVVQLNNVRALDPAYLNTMDAYKNASSLDAVVRDYMPGDDIRSIHWKASAREGKLLVRNTIGEEINGIGIIMDSSKCSYNPMEFLPVENKICETVLALSMYFIGHNIPVNVYSMQGDLNKHTIGGISQFDEFYKYVSTFVFDSDAGEEKLIAGVSTDRSFYSNSFVVLVLHELNETAKEMMRLLKQNNISSVVYLITDDKDEANSEADGVNSNIVLIPTDADLEEVIG